MHRERDIQLSIVAAGFVITANEKRQDWCGAFARVVFVEVAELAVLGRTGHDPEVGHVAHGLEVAADDQHVDREIVLLLGIADRVVESVQLPVALFVVVSSR